MKRSLIKATPKNRTIADLQRLQVLPLEQKVNLSLRRIKDFLIANDNKCYISFSGGKDSTVLLDLVRIINPSIEAVFVDTGLEFSSIRGFVKTFNNISIVKPKMRFDEVIKKYGYPVASKEVSQKVNEAKNTKSDHLRNTRLNGDIKGNGKLAKKWKFLIDAPFECSQKCCDVMKKNPAKLYEKQTGKAPILGTMAEESALRMQLWVKSGCNMFDAKRPKSTPLSFWTEKDIWDYIKSRDLKYADIYDNGAKRTGCVFCMFGYWSKNDHGTPDDRMELLKRVEPKKYEYCMNRLGLRNIIDYVDIKLK
jgi:3'-phosphoadenosine 5'-phosphosulfate sulfotransferase (PAPS reductase)/FAD synthetase